jgi:hypothetical protein
MKTSTKNKKTTRNTRARKSIKVYDFWDLPKLAVRIRDKNLSQKIDSIVFPYENHKRT